ncbi:reverse transcriptase domain-containing protein [Tanacetum coccineum]
MQNLGDISNPKTAFDMALTLMAKAFTLNDTTPTNNNQRSSSNSRNMWIAQPGMNMDQDRQMLMIEDTNVGNQNGLSVVLEIANQYGNGNVVTGPAEGNGNSINGHPIRCYNCRGEGHYASNCTVKPRKKDAAYLQTQLQIAQKDEAGIQINSKEFDFMAAAGAYDEIEKVNANCNL